MFIENNDNFIINDNIKTQSYISLCINECKNNYLKLFACNDIMELINKLEKLDYDTDSVCARKMKKVGGWKCSDCEKNANAILCQQCWSKVKDKHLNHDIIYNSSTNGTCDCGDPNTLEESLFCPNHKGPLTKEKEIQNYIHKFFPNELIESFEKCTENLIKTLSSYIIDNIENNIIDNNFKDNMEDFVGLIYYVSNNKALMHILSKIFLKNYKIKTKHNCLLINNNEIKFIKSNKEHDCLCPFIRNLMSAWINENQDILYRFFIKL